MVALMTITAIALSGCGKSADSSVDVQNGENGEVTEISFPLKETAELSFITSAETGTTQEPNERIIFQRLKKKQTYILIGHVLYLTSLQTKRILHWLMRKNFRMACLMLICLIMTCFAMQNRVLSFR